MLRRFAAGSECESVQSLLGTSYRMARRVVIGTVGSTVLAIGLALIVLPGPAFVVIPLGLGILSLEFAWVRHWRHKLEQGASAVLGGGLPPGDRKPVVRGDREASTAGSSRVGSGCEGGQPAPPRS